MTDYYMYVEPAGTKATMEDPAKQKKEDEESKIDSKLSECPHTHVVPLDFPTFFCQDCRQRLRYVMIGGRRVYMSVGLMQDLWSAFNHNRKM